MADPAAIDIADVRMALPDAPPDPDPTRPDHPWQAAVAIVLAPGDDGLDVAMIERPHRPGDRWSGQMALPGGKREPSDADLAETAARETAEEVGLALPEPLGRLPDQHGRTTRGLIAPFVYGLDAAAPMRPNPGEVAAADWIALSWLFDPANAVRHRWVGLRFPGIAHRDRVIWGLTHRILDDLGSRLGLRLDPP